MHTVTKAYCRAFQFAFNVGQYFIPRRKPEVLGGAGCIKCLPKKINSKGFKKVLIVTDEVLHKIGLLDSLFASCDKAGLNYVLYDGAQVNPSIECIEDAVTAYHKNKCDAFIAFGGGSAMDCAKAAAARIARPKKTIQQLGGTLKVLAKIPTIFAVPTTAGTGSETTLAAIVTDYSTHHKYAIQDVCLIPHYAILDPELTIGLPPHITSTTGMDALTHAVEAYTNIYTPKYTDRLAEKATKLIFDNLKVAYDDGKNIEARDNMLYGSFYAGEAFSRACVGNVHAIAHTLGGLYGTPHGLANAVILPIVLEDYGAAVYKSLARLAESVGIAGRDDGEKARAFIQAIRDMNCYMNIPEQFDFILEKDIPQMAEWAAKEANPIYSVPVIWDKANFIRVINKIRTPNSTRAYSITDDCIGCTLCAKSCPVGAVEGKLKEKHTIKAQRCIRCGVCANVCNKSAVLDASGKLAVKVPKSKWKKPVIDSILCSACSMCVHVCGREALEISRPTFKGDIKVFAQLKDENLCVDCGACEGICPLDAIKMEGGDEA